MVVAASIVFLQWRRVPSATKPQTTRTSNIEHRTSNVEGEVALRAVSSISNNKHAKMLNY
jgi:hypothetical protein